MIAIFKFIPSNGGLPIFGWSVRVPPLSHFGWLKEAGMIPALREGDVDLELGSFAKFAVDCDTSVVLFDDPERAGKA